MHILLLLLVGASRAAIQLRGCHRLDELVGRLQDAAAEMLRLCMSLATTCCCCGATVLLRSCAECAARMLIMLQFVKEFQIAQRSTLAVKVSKLRPAI
jgi:hypothetical protein